MSHHVDGIRMPKAMRVHVLADEFPIPLDKLPSPLLGYREEGRITRDVVASRIIAQLLQRFCIKWDPSLLASLCFHDVDDVVMIFDVSGPQVQQLIDADPRTPQHTHQQVVTFTATAGRVQHLINLCLFEVVGDVLHATIALHLRKCAFSKVKVSILGRDYCVPKKCAHASWRPYETAESIAS